MGYLESAVGFCDLGWSRVCQPPARETDAVGVQRTLAAYRGAAGAAGVIEVEYIRGMRWAAPFPKELVAKRSRSSERRELGQRI